MYHGTDLHAIDAKGRVNIPAKHRRVATAKGCTEFWFSPGLGPFCALWDSQAFGAFAERIAALPRGDVKAQSLQRRLFSNASVVEPDGQGRVVIPEHLRALVGLESQVLILGVYDHLQLWNPETHASHEAANQVSLEDTAQDLPF